MSDIDATPPTMVERSSPPEAPRLGHLRERQLLVYASAPMDPQWHLDALLDFRCYLENHLAGPYAATYNFHQLNKYCNLLRPLDDSALRAGNLLTNAWWSGLLNVEAMADHGQITSTMVDVLCMLADFELTNSIDLDEDPSVIMVIGDALRAVSGHFFFNRKRKLEW